MSNELSTIFSSIEETSAGIEWAAFYLSGHSDDFWGFRELDVCINGETARRGLAKQNTSNEPTGTALENLLNENGNQSVILGAAVLYEYPLKCTENSACSGVLLAVIKRCADERSVTIPLNWRGFDCGDLKWEFKIPPGFRGLMIQYENVDDGSQSKRLREDSAD